MKRPYLAVMLPCVTLIAGGVPFLVAQPGADEKPKIPPMKIAVVNFRTVLDNYWKAKAFKTQLEESLLPYKAKAKMLSDEIKSWEDEMRKSGIGIEKADEYRKLALRNKRELEEMNVEISKELGGKKQEDKLVILWKDINDVIKRCADTYGFQVVFGYTDPDETRDEFSFRSRRFGKNEVMDMGAMVPLYIHGSVDLTHAVVETLNSRGSWLRESQKKADK